MNCKKGYEYKGEENRVKKIAYIILIIIIISIYCATIDYLRVSTFRKPFFCIGTMLMKDGGSGRYVGLGYSFNIEGNFLPDEFPKGVMKFDYYILGMKVKSVIRDEKS